MTLDRPRPRDPRPFDYWHEKVALTKLANDLAANGWEVGLSVNPKRFDDNQPLAGAKRSVLDDEFQRRFDAEPSPGETQFRYRFYRDQPGHLDLVARRGGSIVVVEGKGRSAANRRGAIAQMVGALMLERRPDRLDIRYAILLPGASPEDSPEDVAESLRWDRALRNFGGLDWLEINRISRASGTVRTDSWTQYATNTDRP